MKKWLKYLVYALLVIAGVYLKGLMESIMQKDYYTNSKINFALITVTMFVTIIIGIFIGLEQLVNEIKKEGKWKLNVPKLVLLGIPSLYASLIYYIASIRNINVYNILVNPVFKFFGSSTAFIALFQLLLGYVIITSFYKETAYAEAITDFDSIGSDVKNGTENEDNDYENNEENEVAQTNMGIVDDAEKEVISPDDSWSEQ